ncbi:AcrR family transcriptional regulator [Kutzneria buriramensis]|uniref:AcrR family transcriptional regulator n=2 Tax=Kutzneria buriramensis TaxID=1045776 RepID=A0A3E0HIB0_9PSEU|nr:AcrR family transcriptional regulator [Kutzneria buriramensis]
MNSPSGRTFADEARRRQIIDCAIEVIAQEGFAKATLARIAERADLAKSVVLYHFTNKDELVEQVLATVSATSYEFVRSRVATSSTAWERVRGSIEAVVEFVAAHPQHALAGLEGWNQARSLPGRVKLAQASAAGPSGIEETLIEGQLSGEFGEFDPHVLAVLFQQAVDAAVLEAALRPDTDLTAFAAELIAVFDRAIRRRP